MKVKFRMGKMYQFLLKKQVQPYTHTLKKDRHDVERPPCRWVVSMHSMAAHNDGNGRMMDDIVADTAHYGASDGPQPSTGDDYHGHSKLLRFLDDLLSRMPMSTDHIPLDLGKIQRIATILIWYTISIYGD